MKTSMQIGTLTTALLMGSATTALAAAAQFTALPVDALAVKFFDSLVNVWIPIVGLTALIGLVINMFVGFMQIGARVVGFVFGVSLLAGGLPLLKTIFGNNLVTALILP
jgi:hypothetical protein